MLPARRPDLAAKLQAPEAPWRVEHAKLCRTGARRRINSAFRLTHMLRAPRPDLAAKLQAPEAPWREEQAKLLWAEGRHSMALPLVMRLAERLAASSSPEAAAQRARLLALGGKWMAHNR